MKNLYRYAIFVMVFICSMNLLCSCTNLAGNGGAWGPQIPGMEAMPNEPAAIWKYLQQRNVQQLQSLLQAARNSTQRGWIELALISKQTLNDQQLSNVLQQWSQTYPNHPGSSYVPTSFAAIVPGQSPHKIALILPLHGLLGGAGQAVRDGFLAEYYAAQQKGSKTTISIIDSADKSDIQALYREAVASGADFVVGPLDKENLEVLKRMGSLPVPTLALNASDNATALIPQLYQFALSPLDEANQVADKAIADGRRRVIIIAPKGNWGNNIATIFGNRFQNQGGVVVDKLIYSQGQNLPTELKQLLQYSENGSDRSSGKRRQDFDMIFLVALPQYARQIRPLLSFYYLGDLPVYSISLIYNGVADPNLYRDMNGVLFCDIPWLYNNPTLNTNQREQIAKLWSNPFHNYARLYALGLDAFKLSENLTQLPTNPNAGISGATGRLYLGQDHRILRKLVWLQFRGGKPVVIGE